MSEILLDRRHRLRFHKGIDAKQDERIICEHRAALLLFLQIYRYTEKQETDGSKSFGQEGSTKNHTDA